MCPVAEDHVEEDDRDLRIVCFPQQALMAQCGVQHGMQPAHRELVAPHVDHGVSVAAGRGLQRVPWIERRVRIDRPDVPVQQHQGLITQRTATV